MINANAPHICKRLVQTTLSLALLSGLTGCLGLGANIGFSGGRPHVGVSVSGRVNPHSRQSHKHAAAFVRIESVNTGVVHVPVNGRTTVDVTVNSNTGVRLASNPSCATTAIKSVGPGRQTIVVDVYGRNSRGDCRLDLIASAASDNRIADNVSLAISVY